MMFVPHCRRQSSGASLDRLLLTFGPANYNYGRIPKWIVQAPYLVVAGLSSQLSIYVRFGHVMAGGEMIQPDPNPLDEGVDE